MPSTKLAAVPAVVLACLLAFLAAGALGLHAHLCVGGDAAAAAMHLHDGEHLEHHDPRQSHEDIDFDPLGEPLPKLPKIELPVLALITSCLFLLARRPGRLPRPPPHPSPPRIPPRFTLPLLRAPPR